MLLSLRAEGSHPAESCSVFRVRRAVAAFRLLDGAASQRRAGRSGPVQLWSGGHGVT